MSIRSEAIRAQLSRGGIWATITNVAPCSGGIINIIDEVKAFDYELNGTNTITLDGLVDIIGNTTPWNDTETYIVSGTVIVTNATATSAYVENVDYSLNYETGILTRITSGQIIDLQILRISYNYFQACLNAKTGTPRKTCTTCQGTGTVDVRTFNVKALLHIPHYNSTYMQSGVFKLGDAIFTTVEDVSFNSKNYSDGGFICMDKIVLQGRPGIWYLVSQPDSIQMGEWLMHRHHIRKLEK